MLEICETCGDEFAESYTTYLFKNEPITECTLCYLTKRGLGEFEAREIIAQ